jgi:hypothetical protein
MCRQDSFGCARVAAAVWCKAAAGVQDVSVRSNKSMTSGEAVRHREGTARTGHAGAMASFEATGYGCAVIAHHAHR